MQGLDLQCATRRPYLTPPTTPEESFLNWWRIVLTDTPSLRHLAPALHVRRLVLDWYVLTLESCYLGQQLSHSSQLHSLTFRARASAEVL